jgi:hypothetical protein
LPRCQAAKGKKYSALICHRPTDRLKGHDG